MNLSLTKALVTDRLDTILYITNKCQLESTIGWLWVNFTMMLYTLICQVGYNWFAYHQLRTKTYYTSLYVIVTTYKAYNLQIEKQITFFVVMYFQTTDIERNVQQKVKCLYRVFISIQVQSCPIKNSIYKSITLRLFT